MTKKYENEAKKWKVSMLEVNFESIVNGFIEELADNGDMTTAIILDARCGT